MYYLIVIGYIAGALLGILGCIGLVNGRGQEDAIISVTMLAGCLSLLISASVVLLLVQIRDAVRPKAVPQ